MVRYRLGFTAAMGKRAIWFVSLLLPGLCAHAQKTIQLYTGATRTYAYEPQGWPWAGAGYGYAARVDIYGATHGWHPALSAGFANSFTTLSELSGHTYRGQSATAAQRYGLSFADLRQQEIFATVGYLYNQKIEDFQLAAGPALSVGQVSSWFLHPVTITRTYVNRPYVSALLLARLVWQPGRFQAGITGQVALATWCNATELTNEGNRHRLEGGHVYTLNRTVTPVSLQAQAAYTLFDRLKGQGSLGVELNIRSVRLGNKSAGGVQYGAGLLFRYVIKDI